VDDIIDPAYRDIDVPRQPVLADAEGYQELLKEDLTGSYQFKFLHHFRSPLMVIRYFHIQSIAIFPPETDTPLIVDPDAESS
jgi:hypothetical protein